MSHNRDLSAAAAQLGFHSSNIGIGSEAPRYALDVYNSNLLVSGPSAGNIILEDRGVGDSSRPFHVVSSDGGKFVINRSNRNASGTTTSSVNSLTLSSGGNLGLSGQTSPASNIHIGDISGGYELKISANALQFNRTSNSYIDQLNDTGSILFRMTSSNTEAMRITSDGDMGLGTVSPTARLDVRRDDTDGKIAEFHQSTGYGIQIRSSESVATIRAEYNQALIFETGTTATERLRMTSNGKVHIGSFIDQSNTRLHVGWNTGGTVAGESIIAGTLGNDTTAVSALLTIKNAGNRGSQGHSGGSALAKFEFNNGTAFEIDKSGRVTEPYQPAFNCKLSTATGANFTGYLVFGSVSYNIGSHYNSSNGRFTAPVDGRYLFCWYTNMERAGGNGSLFADWYVNGNARGNRMYTHHSGAWELIGGTIILDLNTNDYVQVYAATSGNWDGGVYGSYSGYLLG